jgi:hypothetical protein
VTAVTVFVHREGWLLCVRAGRSFVWTVRLGRPPVVRDRHVKSPSK